MVNNDFPAPLGPTVLGRGAAVDTRLGLQPRQSHVVSRETMATAGKNAQEQLNRTTKTADPFPKPFPNLGHNQTKTPEKRSEKEGARRHASRKAAAPRRSAGEAHRRWARALGDLHAIEVDVGSRGYGTHAPYDCAAEGCATGA